MVYNPNRFTTEYLNGVASFLDVAKQHVNDKGLTKCPCRKCHNGYSVLVSEVGKHLCIHRMSLDYNVWIYHGEQKGESSTTNRSSHQTVFSEKNNVDEIIADAFLHASFNFDDDDAIDDYVTEDNDNHARRHRSTEFERLLEESQRKYILVVLSFLYYLLQ